MRKRRLRQHILGIILWVVLASCITTYTETEKKKDGGQQSTTEEQDTPQDAIEEITVRTTPPCNSGQITVYAENERVFSYYGKVEILNSGWNGRPIRIIVNTTGVSHE